MYSKTLNDGIIIISWLLELPTLSIIRMWQPRYHKYVPAMAVYEMMSG